jgi:NSS family neurotransmitter:Na+ symporter
MGSLIIAIAFFYIFDPKKAIKEINIGARKPVGTLFVPLVKYGFTITTVIVIALGVAYGGIG